MPTSPESDLRTAPEQPETESSPFSFSDLYSAVEPPPALDKQNAASNDSLSKGAGDGAAIAGAAIAGAAIAGAAIAGSKATDLIKASRSPEKDSMLKGFSIDSGGGDNYDKHQGPPDNKQPDNKQANPSDFRPPDPDSRPANTDAKPGNNNPGDYNPADNKTTDNQVPKPDSNDQQQPTDKQSFGDKLAGIISKIGQFLQSVLPPEYAQYVQQYLPMAEQFISSMLNDVQLSQGQNGENRLEADLKESHTVPDVLPGTNLQVGKKLGFNMKWGANGPELSDISGLQLSGDQEGEVTSGRVDIGDGNPTLYANIKGRDGSNTEVPIPLPDIQSLIGQFMARGRKR